MNRIGREQAVGIGQEMVGACVVLVDQTVEVEQGWVMFYESAEFVESGDEGDRLVGNGPVFVDRAGRAAVLGTALPWREMLDQVLTEWERRDP